jgi:xanthine permease XanP
MAETQSELIYGVDDRPPLGSALFGALQHVLASFVGIITPSLIIGGVLGLGEHIPYLISMALMVSGVGTFIHAARVGPLGTGLICVQGTSFAFLGSVLAAGFAAKAAGGDADMVLGTIFAVCFVAAFVEIFLSFFVTKLGRVLTPLVTGIVITTIGLSLVRVGITDIGGGQWLLDNKPELFGSISSLIVGGSVLATVIALNISSNPWLRITSIVLGMIVGVIVAAVMGVFNFEWKEVALISVPVPFKHGFHFDAAAAVSIGILYCITAIETAGDITANCTISKLPVKGPKYLDRIRRGVLTDGIASAFASAFNSFPTTTFSQNNGVIQLTGIASRYVGLFIGLILICLGLFPVIGMILQQIPKPVLGGATLVMFGTVAAAGIRILSTVDMNRRNMLIMAVCFGLGLGQALRPELFNQLPKFFQAVFSSPISMAGIMAIILTLIIPRSEAEKQKDSDEAGLDVAL